MFSAGRDGFLLLLLGAIWGTSFIGIKLSLESFSPITIAFLRALIAACVLLLVCNLQRQVWSFNRRDWVWIATMGALNTSLPFCLVSLGTARLDAGVVAIIIGTGPFLGVVLPATIGKILGKSEPLHPLKLLGVAVGFIGLVFIVGPSVFAGLTGDLTGQLFILAASTSYVLSGMIQHKVRTDSLLVLGTAQSICAAVILLPVVLYLGVPSSLPSFTAGSAVLYLGVLPTAIALIIRLGIIDRQGVGFMSQVGYFVPLFGVAWGAILLNEQVEVKDAIALACILLGLWIMGRARKPKASPQRVRGDA